MTSPASTQIHGLWSQGVGAVVHFFDHRRSTSGPILKSRGVLSNPSRYRAYRQQSGFDRLAGVAGVLPPGIDTLLATQLTDVGQTCASLRRMLVTDMVDRVRAIRAMAGEWLAHVAPRERVQILTHDHEARSARSAAKAAAQRTESLQRKRTLRAQRPKRRARSPRSDAKAQPIAKRTRLSLQGPTTALYPRLRRRTGIDADYEWDWQTGPIQSYLVFQSTRWRLIRAIAKDWHAILPAPGFCHLTSDQFF
jgi:hypothetical protein